MSEIYREWSKTRLFKIESNRFKDKKYIYTTPFNVYCQGFNNHGLYPYIVSDIYSKLYRMKGYNVLYSILVNNLNDDTLSYSRLRGESFTALKDHYIDELEDMYVGIDTEKLISYSDNNFITFTQKIFKQMYDDGIVSLKKKECFTDFSGHTIYGNHEVEVINEKYVLKKTGDNVYIKSLDVFVIDLDKLPNILETINNMKLDATTLSEIYDILGVKLGLKIPFYLSTGDGSIEVLLNNPEYVGGVTFIAVNPKYVDVTKYCSEDEMSSVLEYIESGNEDYDIFTGLILKNPLTFGDVIVFASYKYDEGIHAGIPSNDMLDHMFTSQNGLDVIDILNDGVLQNSDFLNDKTPFDAHDEIISSFSKEGVGEIYSYISNNEINISMFDDLGVIIPIVTDYLDNISVLDEKFYPVYYNNRFKPNITNEDKLNNSLQLKRMVFSSGFLYGISNIYARCYDKFAGNDEFLRTTISYEEFVDMEGILSEDTSALEILYVIIFNCYLETFGKRYLPFSSYKKIPMKLNQTLIGEQQRLGVSFVREILDKYSADAYRFYLLGDSLNSELSLTLANVEKYEKLVRRIGEAYNAPFEQSNYENSYANSFFREINRLLDSHEISKFTNSLISFFEAYVETHKITKNESIKFLIILSLVAPQVAEDINKNILKNRYSIFYSEFPR